MRRIFLGTLFAAILLSGCGGQGGGMSGMSARHHTSVPEEYVDLKSPIFTDADITQGEKLYTTFCASCHGDAGMGDGPAAASLDPAPAAVAHTSSMLSDGYLYWRIAEGGAEFKSTMPAWKNSMNADETWAVIAYMRTLGNSVDDTLFHAEILDQAIAQNIVTQSEADTFLLVHDALDEYRAAHLTDLPQGSADEVQAQMLAELVNAGTINQDQADDFARVHQLLLDAGLMK